jgi:AmmeMemoRadiSam system protein B
VYHENLASLNSFRPSSFRLRRTGRYIARPSSADSHSHSGDPVALIAPHAGYVYSGPTAAYSFRQLEGKAYDTAIIIAPDHQAPVSHPISV